MEQANQGTRRFQLIQIIRAVLVRIGYRSNALVVAVLDSIKEQREKPCPTFGTLPCSVKVFVDKLMFAQKKESQREDRESKLVDLV